MNSRLLTELKAYYEKDSFELMDVNVVKLLAEIEANRPKKILPEKWRITMWFYDVVLQS